MIMGTVECQETVSCTSFWCSLATFHTVRKPKNEAVVLILVVSSVNKSGCLLCTVEMPAKSDGGTVRTDHHENSGLASPLQRVRHGNHLDSVNRTIAVLDSTKRHELAFSCKFMPFDAVSRSHPFLRLEILLIEHTRRYAMAMFSGSWKLSPLVEKKQKVDGCLRPLVTSSDIFLPCPMVSDIVSLWTTVQYIDQRQK